MRTSPFRLLAAGTLAALVLTGQGCGGPSAAQQQAAAPVTLTVWRVFEGEDTLRQIMSDYQLLHPNVSFQYRQLRVEEYRDELLRAFAEGRGPDIFSVHNTWIGEHQPLMSPLPPSLTIPYTETRGTIRRETTHTLRTESTITPAQVRNQFLDVVAADVIRPYQATPDAAAVPRIWGLPLAVDTMALFYNRDLLNAANIPQPPATWQQFQDAVSPPRLTTVGPDDLIVQSGAAIGTARNVERAFDLLSVIMMQNGTPMVADNGRAAFASANEARQVPGAQALQFYTDFANPTKITYAWNDQQPPSFEAFVNGQTAFFFGYSYHIPLLRARNPRLRIGIAPLPQIGDGRAVNYANYWVETVARASANQHWAWDFIQFAARPENVTSYLTTTRKPPALKSLITPALLEHEDLGVFTNQLLTSQSWYRGRNASVAERAFLDMIDAVNAGSPLEQELGRAQTMVNQTL